MTALLAAVLVPMPWRRATEAADAGFGANAAHPREAAASVDAPDSDDPNTSTGSRGGFSVRAVDKRGRAVRGAEVYVLHLIGDGQPKSTPTVLTAGPFFADIDGFARVTGLPDDTGGQRFDQFVYARVPGERVGARRRSYWSFDNGPAPDDPFEILLVDSAELRGRVVVPRGFEPTDVAVRMLAFDVDRGDNDRTFPYLDVAADVWPERFETRADADGRFVIRDTPARGVRYLAANAPGLGEAQWMDEEGSSKRTPKLVMRREGVLEGRVLHSEAPGDSVEGLTVVAVAHAGVFVQRRHTATVGPDGGFRIGGLPAGMFLLRISELPDGWTAAPRQYVRVTAGRPTAGLDLSLERGTLLKGRVVDDDIGDPVAGVLVSAHFLDSGPEAPEVDTMRTGRNGAFRLRVPTGRSRVSIRGRPSGYRPTRDPEWREAEIDTTNGNKPAGVLFKLQRVQTGKRPRAASPAPR